MDKLQERMNQILMSGEPPRPNPHVVEAEQGLEVEILDTLLSAKHLRAGLANIARWHNIPLDVVEQVAQTVTQKTLGKDLEKLEFEQVVKAIAKIEEEPDAGVREWKLQGLARRFRRTPQQLMQSYSKALFQKQLQPKNIADFKKEHQADINWLVSGWLPQGVTTLIYGDGGAGKTLMVYQLLESVLKGTPWNGYQVAQGSALLVQCDEPELVTAERLDIRGIPDDAPLHVISDWSTEQIHQLEAWVSDHQPKLLVIDSITAVSRYSIFKESDTEYARPILQIRDIARRYGCTVILLHHSNAQGEARGTRAIHNSVDEVWGLSKGDNDSRLLRVQKTRLGRPPGRYRFEFEEDFTFRYAGEEGHEFDDAATQEERIRLWLSEEDRRGISFAPVEVAEGLALNKDSTRRALYELWAKGLIRRRRPKGSPYYLYFLNVNKEAAIANRSEGAIGSYTPLKSSPDIASSDKAIGRSERSVELTVENAPTPQNPDRLSSTTQPQQGLEGDLTCDRQAIGGVLVREEAIATPTPGDIVVVKASGSWVRSGSDKLPWRELPPSLRSASEISLSQLNDALFRELSDGGKVLELLKGGQRVKIRHQKTGRTSVFAVGDVAILRRGG